jgi:hypothetical protein
LLKEFSIFSEDVYPPGEKHAKGYKRVRFVDAFERYLDPQNHELCPFHRGLHAYTLANP